MPRKRKEFEVPAHLRQRPWQDLLSDRLRVALRNTPEGELWKQHLSPHQKREALATGWVPVRGSKSGMFLVDVNPDGNAAVQASQTRAGGWRGYCLVVHGVDSALDAALSKIMLIEADEQLFRKTAR